MIRVHSEVDEIPVGLDFSCNNALCPSNYSLRRTVEAMKPSTDSGADSYLVLDDSNIPGPALFGHMAAESTILRAFQEYLRCMCAMHTFHWLAAWYVLARADLEHRFHRSRHRT